VSNRAEAQFTLQYQCETEITTTRAIVVATSGTRCGKISSANLSVPAFCAV